MTEAEANFPNEPHRQEPSTFSALHVSQEEIDVRFRWVVQDLRLDKVEREVLGLPPPHDRLQKVGAVILNTLSVAARSLPWLRP